MDEKQVPEEPIWCECEHFHLASEPCPPAGEPCGSYLCCIN